MRPALFVSLALSLSSAVFVVGDTTKFFTEELCFTKYGSVSRRPVPTATQAITETIVLPKRTNTMTPTITKPAATVVVSTTSTSTLTSYVTTQTTDTATLTSTDTVTDTATETDTTTTTSTATVTSTLDSTVTIETPSGFTPAASANGYVPRGLANRLDGDNLVRRGGGSKKGAVFTCPKNGGKQTRPAAAKYPQRVSCTKAVEKVILRTKTRTASPTTVSAAATPTSTQTLTVTTTATATSTLADATVTVTATDSATVTTTSTTTTTVTATTTTTDEVPGATTTAYAACAADNLVSSASGGRGIGSIYFAANYAISRADSATDCCNQCQAASCSGFSYYGADCLIGLPDTCQAGVSNGNYHASNGVTPEDGFTVGNGPCGSITYLGLG